MIEENNDIKVPIENVCERFVTSLGYKVFEEGQGYHNMKTDGIHIDSAWYREKDTWNFCFYLKELEEGEDVTQEDKEGISNDDEVIFFETEFSQEKDWDQKRSLEALHQDLSEALLPYLKQV